MQRSLMGLIELIATSIIWGITYTMLKIALLYYDPFQVAFLRFFIASIFFVPIVFIYRERYSIRDIITIIILGATGVFLYQTLFIYGENGLSAGAASFIVSTEPIFIYILSLALKDEKLRIYPVMGIIISTLGLLVLIQPSNVGFDKGIYILFVILAAVAWGAYTISGKNILKEHNSLHVTALSSILGTFMLFPFSGTESILILIKSNYQAILSVLFLGIVATFVGYFLWFDGLKYVRPSIAGATLYITPFVTVFSAALMIGEAYSSLILVGGTMIIIGVAISNLGGVKG